MKASSIQENDGAIGLYEPRVLNGAQTIASINQFYQEHKAKKDILDRLEQIKVVAKVVVSENESFVRNVAINNNRQNPIEPWHLRANDKIQLELEERFARVGIYYERRENSFANEKNADLMARGITQNRPIKMKTMGQAFLDPNLLFFNIDAPVRYEEDDSDRWLATIRGNERLRAIVARAALKDAISQLQSSNATLEQLSDKPIRLKDSDAETYRKLVTEIDSLRSKIVNASS